MFHVEHCQGPFPYTTRKRQIIYTIISDISNLFLNYFFSYLFVRNMALANEYSKGVRAKFFGRPKKIKGKENQGSLQVFIPKKLRSLNDTAEQTLWVLSADGTSADVRNVRFGKEEKEGFVIVRSGLRPGDRILVNPPEGLKPGDRVNAKEVP